MRATRPNLAVSRTRRLLVSQWRAPALRAVTFNVRLRPPRHGVDALYPSGYHALVYQLRRTDVFDDWLLDLRDVRAKARILARLESARLGNLGDVRSVGDGVSEMRVDVGAGYRAYFTRRQRVVIILLCGGDKSGQARDIARAKQMVQEIERG